VTLEPGSGPGSAETLRPEARPLPYPELDRQQQAALDRVVGLLTAAAQDAKALAAADRETRSVPPSPAGPYLDSNRCSRNILVSGERGTGKTTLMLSLARALGTGSDPALDSLPAAVAEQARDLKRRLIWLETLDMEPLASNANLLGAVLARIEEAVGARFPDLDKMTETVPLLYPGSGYHDMSRELARLQTSVALTFGGNLGDRAGSLDPDTFAVESRRAERERLGLDRRFAGVLTGLSAAVASVATGLDAPVFVLPVDDVDLNVGTCVPLLRLLRATTSPHLIVLLAADATLLSTILWLKYQGELAQVSAMPTLSEAHRQVAADLAVNALRKHLPAAQRVVLGLVEPGRALTLRPLGADQDSLGQRLREIVLPADSAALQVADGFGVTLSAAAQQPVVTTTGWSSQPQDDPARLTEQLAPFSWPRVLRQPLRRLVDLYLDSTVHARDEQQRDPLIHHTADTPLIQLARSRFETLRDSVRGQGETEGNRVEAKVSAVLDQLPAVPPGEAPVVQRLSWHGWRANLDYVPLDNADGTVLVGCIELLGDRWRDSSPPAAHLAPVRATCWPGDTYDRGRWVTWPWVTHSTFWGYERAMAWLAEAEQAWAEQPDGAFGSWVAVMTAQLFHAPGPGQPFDRPACPLPCDWTSLVGYLGDLASTPLRDAWLDAVGLLCTPEMGMTASTTVPPLIPPDRADHVRTLRAQRTESLPQWLRKLSGLQPPTSEDKEPENQEAEGQEAEGQEAEGQEAEEDMVKAERPQPRTRRLAPRAMGKP
jgi:DNA polymerase III delta prime subunit